jgi:hypothetical protein
LLVEEKILVDKQDAEQTFVGGVDVDDMVLMVVEIFHLLPFVKVLVVVSLLNH